MIFRHIAKIYAVILISIFAVFAYMYFSVNSIKKELNDNIDNLLIHIVKEFVENIDQNLKKNLKGRSPLEALHSDAKLRSNFEQVLSTISTNSFRYVYILYRDKNSIYRYLVDGSHEDKGELDQPLDVNIDEWNKVYETKQDNIIYQYELETLWTTYLHPILHKDQVVAVLAVDFSFELPDMVKEIIKPLNRSFLFIFIAILVLILLFAMEIYFNYKMKIKSYTDSLTGVYNRHYLRVFLKSVNIDNYQVLMFDIDHFKKINDNYGHKAGDIVLQDLAKIVKKLIREEDLIFRYGGEEFLLFVKVNGDFNVGEQIAKRIKDAVEKEKFIYEDQIIKTTISVGINKYPQRFKTIDQVIRYADEMLYLAKKDGRNCIKLEHENYKTMNKLTISEIKEAIEHNRIVCYYQPIFDSKTLSIVKYEALVRLIKKDQTVVGPYFFLEQIFSTTLYTELTNVVIENVFNKIEQTGAKISINLNFSDILDSKIYDSVIKSIKKHKTYASLLAIELLEYEELENIDIIKKRIDEIRSYGVLIALDDFGSGYANYEIFKHLPIDIIKIDGSLIKDLPNSEISLKIVKSIILLAKELDIKMVAEFVHSKEVLSKARFLGIEYLQGFYLSPPQENI
ncbi:bifunctional diguanylate cyclase/phosphodiesterase [Hydrogenimonas thermophila]|uniref:Diguanylate cyclase (GGDEF) domain-containing protein n=1 Tax=Hydrogenimonas thermophila TaxID=223786 RepID=A0A1I5SED6_9BACT|nr:bifunctional diguanylate cyclase/phosphodiesterase [Hydrogenimonas thermophila]SFP69075.1 diguanylate cyclase (GGDEF) domain-containing protein [Hydrogenimonas thermophila]